MAVYDYNGNVIIKAYAAGGSGLPYAYDAAGSIVFPDITVPSGALTASSVVALPDIYGNGHGWTCTGLVYDAKTDTFLVGDIGKALPSSSGYASKIIRVSADFGTVIEQIPLYTSFASMQDVQGVTIDTADDTIWFCSPYEDLMRHIDSSGNSIGSFAVANPTGVSYSVTDDTLWVVTYDNAILHMSKAGAALASYSFAYSEALDQCFYDAKHGNLYITAGNNYTTTNNIYRLNTATGEQDVVCTVDSYSVEGIWIGADKMVIVNDGYYHSAAVAVNQANIYALTGGELT